MFEGLPYYPSLELVNQDRSLHLGRVVNVADPEGRGRVKVECLGLLGSGKENWTGWIESAGRAIGSTQNKGDMGFWQTLQPNQAVLVGFMSGDPFAMFCLPAMPCQDGKGKNKQLTPLEAKNVGKDDPRKATRITVLKTESGHTLLMDDNGKQELLALLDWTGAGLYISSEGKQEDDKEKEDEESKPRKGKRRETKTVFTGDNITSEDVSGTSLLGINDISGSGLTCVSSKDGSQMAIYIKGTDGKAKLSFILDGVDNRIVLTAGKTQFVIDGTQDTIRGTNNVIKKAEFASTDEFFEGIDETQKKRFKRYQA